jgi:hypothetical protein
MLSKFDHGGIIVGSIVGCEPARLCESIYFENITLDTYLVADVIMVNDADRLGL